MEAQDGTTLVLFLLMTFVYHVTAGKIFNVNSLL